jgi:hypothetical protein
MPNNKYTRLENGTMLKWIKNPERNKTLRRNNRHGIMGSIRRSIRKCTSRLCGNRKKNNSNNE